MAMANNEHTIVGDLLAAAKGIDRLFTQTQSLQALLGRARTTPRPTIACVGNCKDGDANAITKPPARRVTLTSA